MIIFKFKDKKGKYITLKDIRSLRLILQNKKNDTRGVFSQGWRNYLQGIGDKNIVIRISGILYDFSAECILREYAFTNDHLDCELIFNVEERVYAKCLIESYERCCEAGNLESFNMVLLSSGVVRYSEKSAVH